MCGAWSRLKNSGTPFFWIILLRLFWRVDDDNVSWDTYFCNFMSEVTFDSRKQADSVNHELSNIDVKMTDTAVLDRQQRLTS